MDRYRRPERSGGGRGWATSLGFWTGATYRAGARIHRLHSGALRLPLLALYKAAALPLQLFRKVEIPARTPIGPGLCLPNPWGIVMPSDVEVGPGCTLHAGVTLGLGPIPGVPKLGRGVVLMPGAKVLGGVVLGDEVVVGANVVVTKDVPAGVVLGSPAARVAPRGGGPADGDAGP